MVKDRAMLNMSIAAHAMTEWWEWLWGRILIGTHTQRV